MWISLRNNTDNTKLFSSSLKELFKEEKAFIGVLFYNIVFLILMERGKGKEKWKEIIEYTYTWNCFTNRSQRDPDNRWTIRDGVNESFFDPYYCHLRLVFDLNQTWDNQLAMDIATMLLTQWYIHRVRIIPDARVTSPSPFGMEQWYFAILLILTLLVRRKRQKEWFKNKRGGIKMTFIPLQWRLRLHQWLLWIQLLSEWYQSGLHREFPR